MFKKYNIRNLNVRLIIIVLLLCSIGVLLIRSATMDNIDYESMPKRQIFGIVVGLAAMIVMMLVDYNLLFKVWPIVFLASFVLLLAVRVFGSTTLGAKRWVDLPLIGRLQPSEFSKIAIILNLAAVLQYRRKHVNSPLTWGMIIALIAPQLLLIVTQPDLSTTILCTLVILTMIYVAKLSYKIIGIALAVIVPTGIWFIYSLLNGDTLFLKEYQVNRILSFVDPQKYQDKIYQQENAVMAIGSGGFWGKGLNTTSFESVKNGNYLSEAQTDFIFTIAGEEIGFVGCMIMLGLVMTLIIEIMVIAKNADSLGGRLICVGVSGFFAYQTFIHVAVNLWLMPNTGLPMPFVSYGLSSIISSFMLLGLVLNVGLQRKKKEKKESIFSDL
ncbi:MAG: rod shape-determining protein RodA [Lachnospiraceae bacterium]|nr:rod shape-determining protein RodA [Lachnospiraceae bacterium]